MMETSQPRKVLAHLYAMCQSLKSTNRVGLHIKMMHILYECVQTLDYFCFLHDKLEERPMLDIDRDVDFGEWAQKEWIDTDRFALIWEDGQMEAYVRRLATEETSGAGQPPTATGGGPPAAAWPAEHAEAAARGVHLPGVPAAAAAPGAPGQRAQHAAHLGGAGYIARDEAEPDRYIRLKG